MPRLPSGREIAADPAPLRELLKGAASGFNAHHIMALETAEHLLGWLELLALDAEDHHTGRRLKDWRALAEDQGWDAADCAAMEAFIDERVLPAMEEALGTVREGQALLVKSPTVAGALACMWRDGIHPLQVEPE
jgi:hypothetical protein